MDGFREMTHNAQRGIVSKIADAVVNKNPQERAKAATKAVDLAKFFLGDTLKPEVYDNFRNAIGNDDNRWWRLVNHVIDKADPNVAKTFILNLGYEAFLRGTKEIRQNRETYKCNIPWLILFDPTSACNMHCAGCWSGTYGDKYDLTFEDMDKIVSEGKQLGTHLYMLTGGEPLVRRGDILRLARKHNDVEFAVYTNSTLINRELCEEVVKAGNILFLLSIEGDPAVNDSRRGMGHYNAVMNAMHLLGEYGIIFGTSVCYTSRNIESVTSDEFFRMIADNGAHFGFYFHYMPVGKKAVTELLPTPSQREYMIERIRFIRSEECDIEFYPMDFQNDGEYVGGCIAGGRNYFHINSAGDAEPCVFIHYSDSNIHDHSILDILQSPIFMAYHDGQPFNHNHLRPCPMLENPELIKRMVEETGAHNTDLEEHESVDELCNKCKKYAEQWTPVADRIWSEKEHVPQPYQNYAEGNVY